MKRFGAISTLLILLFAGYVVIAASPELRIARTCSPINWASNITTTAVLMVSPKYERSVEKGFNKACYVCQYTIWRLFYGSDYEEQIESQVGSNSKSHEVVDVGAGNEAL